MQRPQGHKALRTDDGQETRNEGRGWARFANKWCILNVSGSLQHCSFWIFCTQVARKRTALVELSNETEIAPIRDPLADTACEITTFEIYTVKSCASIPHNFLESNFWQFFFVFVVKLLESTKTRYSKIELKDSAGHCSICIWNLNICSLLVITRTWGIPAAASYDEC